MLAVVLDASMSEECMQVGFPSIPAARCTLISYKAPTAAGSVLYFELHCNSNIVKYLLHSSCFAPWALAGTALLLHGTLDLHIWPRMQSIRHQTPK